MYRIMTQGMEDLLVGIVAPIILSTVATIIYLVIHGWRGICNALSTWGISCFMGVLAHWACLEYAVSGTLSAIIISMSALLSHTILDILFHPQIRKAFMQRLTLEIHTRGRTPKRADD